MQLPTLAPGIEIIDSHCHLDERRFADDRAQVIARALNAGVTTMISIGASDGMANNYQAITVAESHPQIWATVGVHPHDASIVDDTVISELRRLAAHPKVVAIGETGLDYYYDNSPRAQQQDAFRRSIALARELGLPLSIHLRDAYEDAAEILRTENAAEIGGVIHCFSGTREHAHTLLDLNFDLSFSGVVTFKNAEELRQVARDVPANRFMVETDAPFLAPIPQRGKRNEPAFVLWTAALIAEVRGQSLDEVAAATSTNVRHRFLNTR